MKQKPVRFNFTTVNEMREAAAIILPEMVDEYLNAGSGKELTLGNNRTAFGKWNLVPRRLQGISLPDLSTSIFGQSYAIPFGAAPVGMQMLFHETGELGTTKACHSHKAPCILSTVSNLSYAEASGACKVKPWFQLYPTDNLSITQQLINAAENAGAEVIVLTVDVPVLGKRKHNARSLLKHPNYKHLSFGNLENHLRAEDNIHHVGLNWDLFHYILENTKCKIVVKGILHPDDALLCIENGADGIIISNHGGRQLDGAISTIDALVDIKSVLPASFPVLIDGGVRSAEDILKALLLGAKMVFLGRPICYGLAVGGYAGVDHLLQLLKIDLERNMKLMGIADLNNLQSNLIRKV